MAKQEIRVVYTVNGTTCNAKFTCESASITMSLEATVIAMVDGLDERGSQIITAQFREACSVLRFAV